MNDSLRTWRAYKNGKLVAEGDPEIRQSEMRRLLIRLGYDLADVIIKRPGQS